MVDQAGHSATAIVAASATLSARHTIVSDTDRALADAVTAAHTATVRALRRLDAIATDIDAAVLAQDAFALDTSTGVREFHRFLIEKQREIISIVSETATDSQAKSVALQKLSLHYAPSPAVSG